MKDFRFRLMTRVTTALYKPEDVISLTAVEEERVVVEERTEVRQVMVLIKYFHKLIN